MAWRHELCVSMRCHAPPAFSLAPVPALVRVGLEHTALGEAGACPRTAAGKSSGAALASWPVVRTHPAGKLHGKV